MTILTQLERGLDAMGLALDAAARAKLVAYLELIGKWNKVHNLTAVREPAQMVVLHLLDSLSVLPHVAHARTLLDVGTGAGLPGIPIAIARPDVAVTLLETREVKLAFLHHVCSRLDRRRLAVARTSDFVTTGGCDALDLVVARAVASVPETLARCELLLPRGGELWLMRGPSRIGEEGDCARDGWNLVSEREVRLPVEDATRRILVWRLTRSQATG